MSIQKLYTENSRTDVPFPQGRDILHSVPREGMDIRSNGTNQNPNPISTTSSSTYPPHYLIQEGTQSTQDLIPTYSGSCDSISVDFSTGVFSSLPSFTLKGYDLIYIPRKVRRILERYVSVNDLRTIDEDPDTARELCMIILSNLSDSYWLDTRHKRLSSEIMHRQTSSTTKYVYRRILDVLLNGSDKKGPIIQQGEDYSNGSHSREYGLTDTYFGKGVESYKLNTSKAKSLRDREYYRLLSEAVDDAICRNLFHIYQDITIPTNEQIHEEAHRLISNGYRTKKGKALTFLNKNSKTRWKDSDSRSFVEESVELFGLLTNNGYALPIVGDENSGGRVVDSFTLMPSWIRNMITIDGERLVEADFSALHPNLIQTIYGGSMLNITHQQVSDFTGIDKQTVKTEHLSMFNRKVDAMVRSPLYDLYDGIDTEMMDRVIQDKTKNGHKITSKRMFAMETDLMTRIIFKLNQEGIYVLYVYDALMSRPEHRDRMIAVMNETAKEMNIHTTAK